MYIGFDTSNYTTSVALFDGVNMIQQKELLMVKDGERGLRQSEALFQHTVNLPKLIQALPTPAGVKAVAVSMRPRNQEGSYMPCFLAGYNTASAVAHMLNVPLYTTSHQVGHILAALYSVNKLDLIGDKFLAFHVSGGTTEALLVEPHKDEIIKTHIIAGSTDLKAGQLIDRTGVMLGFSFPCGAELERIAMQSDRVFDIHPSMIGTSCSLSGVENKVKDMISKGETKADVAAFVLQYIAITLEKMTTMLKAEYGSLPLLFVGGVMADEIIKNIIIENHDAYFAKPEFSCDNAAGIAVYAGLKEKI